MRPRPVSAMPRSRSPEDKRFALTSPRARPHSALGANAQDGFGASIGGGTIKLDARTLRTANWLELLSTKLEQESKRALREISEESVGSRQAPARPASAASTTLSFAASSRARPASARPKVESWNPVLDTRRKSGGAQVGGALPGPPHGEHPEGTIVIGAESLDRVPTLGFPMARPLSATPRAAPAPTPESRLKQQQEQQQREQQLREHMLREREQEAGRSLGLQGVTTARETGKNPSVARLNEWRTKGPGSFFGESPQERAARRLAEEREHKEIEAEDALLATAGVGRSRPPTAQAARGREPSSTPRNPANTSGGSSANNATNTGGRNLNRPTSGKRQASAASSKKFAKTLDAMAFFGGDVGYDVKHATMNRNCWNPTRSVEPKGSTLSINS